MNNTDKEEVKKLAREVLRGDYSKRIGASPTDSLQLTNRKYVNLNGTTINRPKSSVIAVIGQQYFDTTIGRPVFFNGTRWVDGAGSIS
jgi:hypothetical protein